MNWIVYGLVDPRSKEVRYVGWTSNIRRRMREHCCPKDRERAYKDNWLRELKTSGLSPICITLETGNGDGYGEAEKHWIAKYRDSGVRLTNITDGGDGATGHIKSIETRLKLSSALKGRPRPREVIERAVATKRKRGHTQKQYNALRLVSLGNKGRKQPRAAVEARARALRGKSWGHHSEEVRKEISKRFKGVPKSPEQRAKISAARIGYKPSKESIQKMIETRRRKKEEASAAVTSWLIKPERTGEGTLGADASIPTGNNRPTGIDAV